jgi:putative membrane-bound dehydrogenase-like protein
MLPTLVLSACLLFTAEDAPAPLPPEEAVKAMKLPDGFRATLFAAEPDVVQPISFCIDHRGRIFVAEAMNYGDWKATGSDRISILEDTDGDGRADKRTLFYEGLNYVTGIEVGFGGVWAISPPNLYFIPDKNGDDKPDAKPQVLFDGFGYKESRHNLANGFTWGPDGWLYAGHGRTSPSDVGRPGAKQDERVHCDGGVYRIHPTRLVFENFADGTTNPWGVDFDDYGQCFVSNCVNPHLFHVIQGAHYEPWRNRPSSRYAYERIATIADHLHYPGEKWEKSRGGAPETLAMGGGHAHCGTLIYLGDSFPPAYRNTVLMNNVHGKRINNDVLERKGSGYVAGHGKDFMLSGDPWFMGVTLQTGPDGSVFVSDWSDTGECHTYKPQRSSGRIFQLSYGEAKAAMIDVSKLNEEELVALHLHKNDWHVRHARRRLQERQADGQDVSTAIAGLRQILAKNEDVTRRLRALWTLHALEVIERDALAALLDDRDEYVRAWAIQLLCERAAPPESVLGKFSELAERDPSPLVRLYLAAALQRLPPAARWPIVERLVAHAEDAADPNLPLMIWYALEPLVPLDQPRALALLPDVKLPQVRKFIARRAVEK